MKCNHPLFTTTGIAIMALTLRPTEQQEKDINKLKEVLGIKSSSKALLDAAALYPKTKSELESSRSEVQKLTWQLSELKASIHHYADAKNEMLVLANK